MKLIHLSFFIQLLSSFSLILFVSRYKPSSLALFSSAIHAFFTPQLLFSQPLIELFCELTLFEPLVPSLVQPVSASDALVPSLGSPSTFGSTSLRLCVGEWGLTLQAKVSDSWVSCQLITQTVCKGSQRLCKAHLLLKGFVALVVEYS